MIIDTEEYEQLKQIKTNLEEQRMRLHDQQRECDLSDQWKRCIINLQINLLDEILGVYEQ